MNVNTLKSNPYLSSSLKSNKDVAGKYVNKDKSLIKNESVKDISIKNEIAQLEIREKMVINHEKMHMSVGGSLASNPTYTYVTGPDGKKYVSGGQVDMKMPSGGSLDALLHGLKKIKSAATAVGNPSGADINTAATAAAIEASVLKEVALKKMNQAYEKTKEMQNQPKIDKNMRHIDIMIEKSYVSKLSQMKFRTMSKFDLMI